MRHWFSSLLFLILSLICLKAIHQAGPAKLDPATLPKDPQAKAKAIMDYIDDLWRGTSSRATMTMIVQTAHWKRTLQMEAWSLDKDYSLVRITSPKKEAGTTTLKYENDIYNYLPKTDRTIKITSAMMMNSWMGSHFTNDDLVKESRMSEDYFLTILFEGERDGQTIWEVQLDPKPDAAVVWGKILFSARQEDFMPIRSLYYDEEGKLVRTAVFSDYKVMDGRLLPQKMRLDPEDDPGEFTELVYDDIHFDPGLTRDFFSLKNLKRTSE